MMYKNFNKQFSMQKKKKQRNERVLKTNKRNEKH